MKRIILIGLVFLLFYTRFVNLGWGLPYPMHPDERNMAVAVQQLSCPNYPQPPTPDSLKKCFNPHFFAYGQLPLYLAYAGIQFWHLLAGEVSQPTFFEATIALRTISALSSILIVFVLLKIVGVFIPKLNIKNQISKLQSKNEIFEFSFVILIFTFLFLIFQPYAIQFSHFGTTESLLMLFYSLIILYSLKLLLHPTPYNLHPIFLLGIFSGLALGTKTSSVLFLGMSVVAIVVKALSFRVISEKSSERSERISNYASLDFSITSFLRNDSNQILDLFGHLFISLFVFIFGSLFTLLLSSPHSLLNWNDFISSMNYETSIGLGTYIAFYTRQFIGTKPLLFQFQHILPYVLGWPQLLMGMFGFVLLPWRNSKQYAKRVDLFTVGMLGVRWEMSNVKRRHRWHMRELFDLICNNPYNILRFALLLSFLPPSFFFAKWTRFIAPSFPLFSLFAILFLIWLISKIKNQISKLQSKNKIFNFNFLNFILIFAFCILILPGAAYLSVYFSPDVRFTASEWIYKNIPSGSKILSESANVIDLPIPPPNYQLLTPNYQINSFNFYDLDASPDLQKDLSEALKQADYIIVPSRRVFANHTCLSPKSESLNVLKSDICTSQNYVQRTTNYAHLNKYYFDLFSGKSGFEQVAKFSAYPHFEFSILGSTFRVPFTDEHAEETWTVFDHPVIRIYKKIQAPNSNSKFPSTGSHPSHSFGGQAGQAKLKSKELDFSSYQTANYKLLTTNYKLLVADTPEKWEKGLMYVKNREDIGGLDGMIFVFPDSQKRTFWNKNTVSHLTLFWLNKGKIKGQSNLPSIYETKEVITVSSPSIADTVIEVISSSQLGP